ncbi:MAG TPA: lysophospholipid acyltransferase family protein [Verrucomicrobiae bacterium]
MNGIVYLLARLLVAVLQALPLSLVARLGRFGGFLWWMLDFKHRTLVKKNLAAAFYQKGSGRIADITRETFQRIAENAFCAVKTASMSEQELLNVCTVVGVVKLPKAGRPESPSNVVGAVGHFGNFELYARLAKPVTGWQAATTYRGMNQPRLDALVQKLRATSGCIFFERRRDAAALRDALAKGGLFVGILSDQHPNKGGVLVPFMGRESATTTAPAVLALRYDAPLFPVICYRVALARWHVEIGDEISLKQDGRRRSVEQITADINQAFEAAIRRDPANWFWVHNRWKKPRIKKGRVKSTSSEDAPAADRAEAPDSPSISDELPQ